MRIISGTARNLELDAPADWEVRPTAIRARKALFDSLGDFSGMTVLDLFSGTGALALESASRGAAAVVMVENDPRHLACIRENCRRVAAAGTESRMTVLDFDALVPARYLDRLPAPPDLVFADPPYARSGACFRTLTSDAGFRAKLSGARIVWEIPDTPGAMGDFMGNEALNGTEFRRFGGTMFLLGRIK